MSAPPSRRLGALADVLMLHSYHTRQRDGAVIMIPAQSARSGLTAANC